MCRHVSFQPTQDIVLAAVTSRGDALMYAADISRAGAPGVQQSWSGAVAYPSEEQASSSLILKSHHEAAALEDDKRCSFGKFT